MSITLRGHTFQPINLAMAVASVVWLALQAYVKPVDPTVNQAFLLVLGAWVTNKSIRQNAKEERVAAKVKEVDTKLTVLQENAVISKDRADASERREGQRSQGSDPREDDPKIKGESNT